jgi:cytochrome c oxidase cbb3-type subunit 4
MDTYTLMRQFADSWALLAMMAIFIGIVIWALRPGTRRLHRDIADIPLRDDDEARLSEGK